MDNKKNVTHINLICCLTTLIGVIMLFSSCKDDAIGLEVNMASPESTVKVSAAVNPTLQTRDFYDSSEDMVAHGNFLLEYPKAGKQSSSNAIYGTAFVEFGDMEDPTTGYVYFYNDDDQARDLKWKNIWNEGKSSMSFYLHNVNPDYYTNAYSGSSRTKNYLKMNFNLDSPFRKALPLDKEGGSNDLIEGSLSATNSTNMVFTLNHKLSLLKFNLEVFASKSDEYVIDLSRARITVTNLYQGLQSYTPSYTSFSTSTSYKYSTYVTPRATITLRGTGDEPDWEEGYPIKGDYEAEDGELYSKMTYSTRQFVIPPQTIDSSYRPKFIVEIPKEDITGSKADEGEIVTYSGYLPTIMYAVDENGVESLTPKATDITAGYQLTVTASINSPDTELHFSPVRVEAWVSKSSFTINTQQAGIYNLKDFNDMVAAYRAGNRRTLERYGYLTADGSFIFQFWSSVELSKDDIEGCMTIDDTDPINFGFLFNGSVVTLNELDGTSRDLEDKFGQLELFNIVTGRNEVYTGITTTEEFMEVMEILSNDDLPNINSLFKYATIDNIGNSIILDINGIFDLDVEDIFRKMNSKFAGYNLTIEYRDGAKVNLVFSKENDKKLESGNATPQDYLSKLIFTTTTYGVYSTDDFRLLRRSYNEFYPYFNDIMKLFGTQTSAGSWNLYFRSPFTIPGEEFYMSMIPDLENGKPNYSISLTSTVTVEDEYIPTICSSYTYVEKMLKGNGYATYISNVPTIANITYYNNPNINSRNYYLWNYGWFDREGKKWIFRIKGATSSNSNRRSVEWTQIFKTMIPDEETEKFDYEFEFFDITTYTTFYILNFKATPESSSVRETRPYNSEGAEVLKHICLGDYWEWSAEKAGN